MELTWTEKDGKIIVSLFERIDTRTSPSLEKTLNELLEQGYTSIVLDFLKTSYISSAGLRVLLGAAKKLPGDKRLQLTNLDSNVYKVFKLTGFTTIFDILPYSD
ncbi:MAG TPA: STAS domain-containing protein [Bacillota bacterium]|nr:STAS domain-containing protein [Bacillota bacterium]